MKHLTAVALLQRWACRRCAGLHQTVMTLTILVYMVLMVLAITGCSSIPQPGERNSGQSGHGPYPLSPESISAFVYECGGGQRLVAHFDDGQMSLTLADGRRTLPSVETASGAKYSDGEVTFWTKGDEALYGRGGATSACRLDPYQSALGRARLRGVDYRAVGHEPPWFVELANGGDWVVEFEYGAMKYRSSAPDPDRNSGHWTYTQGWWTHKMTLVIEERECSDAMSGERFATEAVLTYRGKEYRGCGLWLGERR